MWTRHKPLCSFYSPLVDPSGRFLVRNTSHGVKTAFKCNRTEFYTCNSKLNYLQLTIKFLRFAYPGVNRKTGCVTVRKGKPTPHLSWLCKTGHCVICKTRQPEWIWVKQQPRWSQNKAKVGAKIWFKKKKKSNSAGPTGTWTHNEHWAELLEAD